MSHLSFLLRIFTEGNILPPDTNFATGLDHLFSYDNIGYLRTKQEKLGHLLTGLGAGSRAERGRNA